MSDLSIQEIAPGVHAALGGICNRGLIGTYTLSTSRQWLAQILVQLFYGGRLRVEYRLLINEGTTVSISGCKLQTEGVLC